MPGTELAFSRSQVNKAGQLYRKFRAPGFVIAGQDDVDEIVWAYDVLTNFRAAHQYPLTKATMGLRSMVKTESCEGEISQRLKRKSTIIDKLARQPEMALARMQDIGGCRAVLRDIDQVYRVAERLRKNGKVQRMVDYISKPAVSGYRSLHAIVKYDDRLIEAQLRSVVQHEWAVTVERVGGRVGFDLKSGVGPPELLEFFEAVSEAMALEEGGNTVDETDVERIRTMRDRAEPFLGRGGR